MKISAEAELQSQVVLLFLLGFFFCLIALERM